jgi:hypothetical protein
MADLNLTGQATSANQIQTRVTQLRTAMELRKPFWDRMSVEKKRAWIASGKDPIMSLAWDVFKYLKNNFFREEDTNG